MLPLIDDKRRGKSVFQWYDDFSSKALASALGTGVRVYDIGRDKKEPLILTYPETETGPAAGADISLLKNGAHYSLVL